MSDETEARRNRVLAILRAADAPIGPTEIARRIGKPWCNRMFGSRKPSPQSNAINPLLGTLVADGTVQRLPKGLYQIAVARPKGLHQIAVARPKGLYQIVVARPKGSGTQATGAAISMAAPRGRR